MILLPILLYLAISYLHSLPEPDDKESEYKLSDDFYIFRIGKRIFIIPKLYFVFMYQVILLLNVLIINFIVINLFGIGHPYPFR
jgi:hypothetical protein